MIFHITFGKINIAKYRYCCNQLVHSTFKLAPIPFVYKTDLYLIHNHKTTHTHHINTSHIGTHKVTYTQQKT